MATMADDLDRFLAAQQATYDGALAELRGGRKTGHWIWFIFPQLDGLGRSEMSHRYGIVSLAEAQAYAAHPVLGARLRECAAALLSASSTSADDILGPIDAVKVRSSMTLFRRAVPGEPVFGRVLDRFYDGRPDLATEAMLGDPEAKPPSEGW
jgi:uncharacterized protein (DUF1810 family)